MKKIFALLILCAGCSTFKAPNYLKSFSEPDAAGRLGLKIQHLSTWALTEAPGFSRKRILENKPWQWRGKFAVGPGPQSFVSPIFLSTEEVLLSTLGGGLSLRNLKTGAIKWNLDLAWGLGSQPLVEDGMIYIAGLDGQLRKIRASTGEVLWQADFVIESWGGVSLSEGTLFVTAGDDSLWAFEEQSGKVKWTYKRPTPKGSVFWSLRGGVVPLVENGSQKLFAGFSDGVVVCLNAQTGHTIWERNFDRPGRFKDADQHMLFLSDLNLVLVPLVDGDLVALKGSDGSTLWTLNNAGGSTPLRPESDKDSLFVTTQTGELQKIDLKSTKTLWSVPFQAGYVSQPAEIGTKAVALTHADRGLLIFSTEKGELLFEFPMGPGSLSAPVYEKGRLLVLSPRNRLHSFRIDENIEETEKNIQAAKKGLRPFFAKSSPINLGES